MLSALSPEPHGENAGVGAAGPSEETALVPDLQREAFPKGYRTERGSTLPPLNMTFPEHDIGVRRRYSDPFLIGIMVGAIAATLGFLMGMIYVLLN